MKNLTRVLIMVLLIVVFFNPVFAYAPNDNSKIIIPDKLTWPQRCSCVKFARLVSLYQPPNLLNASQLKTNQVVPVIGAWIKIRSLNPAGHVAIVQTVFKDYIVIAETNFIPCQYSRRLLKINDPLIIGFYWNYLPTVNQLVDK